MQFSSFCWAFLLILSCNLGEENQTGQNSVQASSPRTMMVDGYVVVAEKLEQIVNATGSLLPNESVAISPERPGKLKEILFTESSYVKKGNLLAKIDNEELIAQLQKLELQEQMAAKEDARGKELLDISAISQEQYDQLLHTLNQIKADINLLKVQIDKTNVRAPFSGLLGLRNVSLGAYITPAESLVELQQINPIKLEFDVPEKFMRDIQAGQEVSFSIVGFNEPFQARIYATAPEISRTTRSFKVRARCPNTKGVLKPGNFAKVEVVTGVNTEATLVPTDAVIPVIDGQQLYVINNGLAEARSVVTGERRGIMMEIVEGVQPGDTVIVSGLLSISDGAPVAASSLVDYSKSLN